MTSAQNPIVLAFSGGLDTSFCVPWLKETYGRPVVTVTVNCGGIDAAAARALDERARALGAVDHRLIEARPEFFDRVIKFLIMGNVRRGNMYPLSRRRRARLAGEVSGAAREGARLGHRRARLHGRRQRPGAVRDRAEGRRARAHDPGARPRPRVAAARAGQVPRGAQDARADARLGVLDEPRPLGRHDRRHGDARLERQYSRIGVGALGRRAREAAGVQRDRDRVRRAACPSASTASGSTPWRSSRSSKTVGARYGIGRGIHLGDTIIGTKGRVAFEAPAAEILISAHRELEKLTLLGTQAHGEGAREPGLRPAHPRGQAARPRVPRHRGAARRRRRRA